MIWYSIFITKEYDLTLIMNYSALCLSEEGEDDDEDHDVKEEVCDRDVVLNQNMFNHKIPMFLDQMTCICKRSCPLLTHNFSSFSLLSPCIAFNPLFIFLQCTVQEV